MGIRVYLVEDQQVMRDALLDFIEASEGLEVCGTAGSAEEALPDLRERRADVVVLDLSLPGKSGYDLLAEIRAESSIPCLVLSGHGEREDIDRAVAAGANGYVSKADPTELAEAIVVVARGGAYLTRQQATQPRPPSG